MGMLLAFAPFIVFAGLDHYLGTAHALMAGAVVAAALILRDRLRGKRGFKILEVGTFVLFAALSVYAGLAGHALSLIAVRLCVDAGLLAIVLVSLAIRQPFTLAYAREQTPAEYWESPVFVRTNYTITAVWAAAFAVMVVAETALVFVPGAPQGAGVAVVVAALAAGLAFTSWYPKQIRKRAAPISSPP